MTPKQKKEHQEAIDMANFLGLHENMKYYSTVHLRKIIEKRKLEVFETLGIDITDGFKQTT